MTLYLYERVVSRVRRVGVCRETCCNIGTYTSRGNNALSKRPIRAYMHQTVCLQTVYYVYIYNAYTYNIYIVTYAPYSGKTVFRGDIIFISVERKKITIIVNPSRVRSASVHPRNRVCVYIYAYVGMYI